MKLNKGDMFENHNERTSTHTHTHTHTHFKDGAKLTNVGHAKYLGISLDEKTSNKPDLNTRITDTLATITTLKYFWQSSAKASWKLMVVNAVVGAKILYGLESPQ